MFGNVGKQVFFSLSALPGSGNLVIISSCRNPGVSVFGLLSGHISRIEVACLPSALLFLLILKQHLILIVKANEILFVILLHSITQQRERVIYTV